MIMPLLTTDQAINVFLPLKEYEYTTLVYGISNISFCDSENSEPASKLSSWIVKAGEKELEDD